MTPSEPQTRPRRARQRLYRLLTISQSSISSASADDSITLSFAESDVTLVCSLEYLENAFGIRRTDLMPERKLLIRGRLGNDDCQLASPDPIAEMYHFRKAPELL